MTKGHFGARLKLARELKQLSQGDLATKTGISKGAISMSERNVTAITIDNLAKICKALQVSADYIVFGEASERDDEWRKLAATENGLALRQVVLNLYHDKRLNELVSALATLTSQQTNLILGFINTMISQQDEASKT